MTGIRLHPAVRGLTDADPPACSWADSPRHVRELVHQIRRAEMGGIAHLAVCTPVGLPVAVGGTDCAVGPGAGILWRLGVRPAPQSCGIDRRPIRSAEQRIAARGLGRAEPGVEEGTARARARDERLGCRAFGREPHSRALQAEDGSLRRSGTTYTLMRKDPA